MEKKRELIQKSLKLCLSNGVENMTPSHNVTGPSEVLERSLISKNIEGQVRKGNKQKLSLVSLKCSGKIWRLVGRKKLILEKSKFQFLHSMRILRKRRRRKVHSKGRRELGFIHTFKPIRRAKFCLLG